MCVQFGSLNNPNERKGKYGRERDKEDSKSHDCKKNQNNDEGLEELEERKFRSFSLFHTTLIHEREIQHQQQNVMMIFFFTLWSEKRSKKDSQNTPSLPQSAPAPNRI